MKTKSIAWFLLGLALIALPSEFVLLLAQESSTKESATSPLDRVDFVRDVLPIFQRSCSKCHGTEIQKSSYRLDVRSVAITGGESSAPNIVPGKSADSPLIRLIEGNGDLVMPPEGNRLTLHEVTMLRRWIDEGATWPDDVAGTVDDKLDWWSLKPLPEVVELAKLLSDQEVKADSKPAISQNASLTIDRFVRATLRQQGIQLSPLADRRTLIRRLYFDLVGLPPSIEETTAYIADMDSDERAYEKIVDNLLASPRYGERWARHWLDAAHFAETHGHDQDRIRENAWPYRDYLIQSFNADKPYHQFVEEQLAGDVIYPSDPQGTVALAFLAAGPWDESSLQSIREDSLDRQIARYVDRDDMIANVMNNFCSLTVQCARCHDHKFDPISQADYYSLQAVFSGVERANRNYDPVPEVHQQRQTLLAQKRNLKSLSSDTKSWLLSSDVQRKVDEWQLQQRESAVQWHPVVPEVAQSASDATLTILDDHSVVSSGNRPDKDVITIQTMSPLKQVTAIRLEVMTDESLPKNGPGRCENGNFHLTEFEVYATKDGEPDRLVELASASSDFDQTDWGIAKSIDKNDETAWGIHPKEGVSHEAVFEFKAPLDFPAQNSMGSSSDPVRLRIVLKQNHGRGHIIGRARLSVTDKQPPISMKHLPEPIASILNVTPSDQDKLQRIELSAYVIGLDLDRQLASLPKPSFIYAAAADFQPDGGLKPPPGPRPVHVLHRGDIRNPRSERFPGALTCIQQIPANFSVSVDDGEGVRRAALARWLTDKRNPLTWRSIVNRVWYFHFGRGLVGTLNDFGHMGEQPSHPELLDWLAVDFRDNGQSMKRLHRLIVTSDTYKQRSDQEVPQHILVKQTPVAGESPNSTQPEHATIVDDADNRFLWKMNRRRLDAECVRDAILSISGRLDLRMGGPSDRQFDLQPGIHVTPKVDYAKFDFNSDTGRRRSIYRFLFRTLPDPFMETLDCPSGDQMTPVRTNSVTVQQALALWNDAFIARHCEVIAERAEQTEQTVERRTRLVFEWILNRQPATQELKDLVDFTTTHGTANLSRLLLNCNEFLFVN